jgi:parallel beta-helix repeat protein
MGHFHHRRTGVVATAFLATLAIVCRAEAGGAVNIDTCQTLTTPNTTYRLIADLTSTGDCLIVAADRITIDLQGHSITGTGPTSGSAITDIVNQPNDLIVIKNGTVSGFGSDGIGLRSNRVSVIAVTATNNAGAGIGIIFGSQHLVKSSTASFNGGAGIVALGNRSQVQQSTANKNTAGGIVAGAACLVTMNTANGNGPGGGVEGIRTSGGCTVSYNTANDNEGNGIATLGTRDLVTHNTAVNNGSHDFLANCPSDVTFNTSSAGFPASYDLIGTGCHAVGNE